MESKFAKHNDQEAIKDNKSNNCNFTHKIKESNKK